jgi:glycosyltransferase involved in cell wall biosynthesis
MQLQEAVRSALSQSDVSVQVIILDDCPEGSAEQAVRSIPDDRITYRRMAPPSGGRPALVRNAGWPDAQGRFIHFLDDDDRAADGAYRALTQALDARPGIGVAFGRVEPFGHNPVVLKQQRAYFSNAARRAKICHWLRSPYLTVANMLFKPTLLVNSACIIRRECLWPLGGYDPQCEIVEDVEFYVQAIRRFGSVFVDRVTLHYRTGDASLMHNLKDDQSIVDSYHYIYTKYGARYSSRELFTLKLLTRTAMRWL